MEDEQLSTGSATEDFDVINVGERLRAVRNLRRTTLKVVAQRSGLSESFLSQVERGHANASIASLQRIAAALGIAVVDLFHPDGVSRARVLRRQDRPGFAYGIAGRKFLLTPEPLENLEVLVGEFSPGGSTGDEPYSHGDSEELFLVLSGRVHVQIGANVYEMNRGDSIVYRSSTPHRASNAGTEPAEVLWVISPPSY